MLRAGGAIACRTFVALPPSGEGARLVRRNYSEGGRVDEGLTASPISEIPCRPHRSTVRTANGFIGHRVLRCSSNHFSASHCRDGGNLCSNSNADARLRSHEGERAAPPGIDATID